jgi:hypothetical protein
LEDFMRRKTFTQLLLATSVAAFVPLGVAQAEPLQSAELTSVIGNKGFEFRGRYTMWKFGPMAASPPTIAGFRPCPSAGRASSSA